MKKEEYRKEIEDEGERDGEKKEKLVKNRGGDRDGRREKRVVGNKMRVWLEGQQKSDGKEKERVERREKCG